MIPSERLYISTRAQDAQSVALRHRAGLELDAFSTAAHMDAEHFDPWDALARQCLRAVPADRMIFHAPHEGLCPAYADPSLRALVSNRLGQAYALCTQYGIRRMVVHAGYLPLACPDGDFVRRSVSFWREFLENKPDDLSLLLKNTLEAEPDLLREIIEGVDDARLRLCLDLEHASRYSGKPLNEWLDCLAPYIAHVHLHGSGVIPHERHIAYILSLAPDATFTLYMDSAGPAADALVQPEGAQDEARAVLRRVFGYDNFRQGQRTLVDALLAGRDALGIMPTGSGKSICFQVPALVREGITLVISPLISLMKDQVDSLRQVGVRAAYLNSSLTDRQFSLALQNAQSGVYRIIYVAPERLLTPRFLRFAQDANIVSVAVDEAHCISQWGQEFRPSYLDIPEFVGRLPRRPSVSAFTATATPKVRQDILRLLALQDPVQVQTGFDRPNLTYEVLRPQKKNDTLLQLVRRFAGQSGIVYCATRKKVESVCEFLRDHGISAGQYHAGMGEAARKRNQEDFAFDRVQIIVATNAFGMGIDKSNVRFIIHYHMPKDIESYYQEAGRAGRDGEPASCILLYSGQDEVIQRRLIELEDDTQTTDPALRRQLRDTAYKRLAAMTAYCRTQDCLRGHILHYFGEKTNKPTCGNCGSCLSTADRKDVTDLALPILRTVAATGERFGLGTILELLRGARTRRLREFSLDTHPNHGALSHISATRLGIVGEQLAAEGYLQIRQGRSPIASLGPRAGDALDSGDAIFLKLPQVSPSTRPSAAPFAPSTLSAPSAPRQQPRAADPVLFEALRALRLRLATEQGVPAFVIFTDATLREMCSHKPRTLAEMRDIKGMGDARLTQYGEAFVRVICQHSP